MGKRGAFMAFAFSSRMISASDTNFGDGFEFGASDLLIATTGDNTGIFVDVIGDNIGEFNDGAADFKATGEGLDGLFGGGFT